MSFLAMTAYIWRREADVLSALALAALVYLLADPRGVYNMGFQFSFLTVAAFALFDLPRESYPTTAIGAVRDVLAQALHTTNVAYWATLPLLAYYFGTISIVAIPSNLLIVPAVSALVIGGMAVVSLFGVFPAVAMVASQAIIEPLIAYLRWVLDLFAGLKVATLPTGTFNAYWLLLIYGSMLLFVRERVRPA
jgi:competence protein ComEC